MGAWKRIVVGGATLALALGAAGCSGNPVQQAADAVTGALEQVDALSVSMAATQAITAVTAYTVSNQRLPATLAEAGFAAPEGVVVKIVPTGGLSFSICASAGDLAFKGENGAVTAVASC